MWVAKGLFVFGLKLDFLKADALNVSGVIIPRSRNHVQDDQGSKGSRVHRCDLRL
jgi:hypothetical protein